MTSGIDLGFCGCLFAADLLLTILSIKRSQVVFTCSKLKLETPEQCLKSVETLQKRNQDVTSPVMSFWCLLLLNLNRFHLLFWCSQCCFEQQMPAEILGINQSTCREIPTYYFQTAKINKIGTRTIQLDVVLVSLLLTLGRCYIILSCLDCM